MRKIITVLSLSLISIASFTTSSEAATRIKFARGSYCGSYSGNFSNGREFVLRLAADQTFTSRNIGYGTQYDVSVVGPKGRVFGNKISADQINYQTPASGDYRIYVESSTPHSSIEFCAY